MSWAEDNGVDAWDFDDSVSDPEELWRDGIHITKAGDKVRLRDMETSHLLNTIRYFKALDTTPLELEIIRRERFPNVTTS